LLLAGLDAAEEAQDFQSALRAINNLAHVVFRHWPEQRAGELLDRMGRIIERSGREDWRPSWHLLRATYFAHVVGDLAAAHQEVELAAIPPSQRSWCRLAAAELALEAGDRKEASELLALLEDLMEPDSQGEERVVAAALRVRLAAMSADQATMRVALPALFEVYRAYEGHHESGSGDLWYHALVSVLRAGLPVDEVEAFMATAHDESGTGRDPGSPADPAWVDHLRGALAEARHQPEEAALAYAAAAPAPTEAAIRRSPAVLADAHIGAARNLLALNRLDEAYRHADAARSILARWPGWRQDEAQALLHRLGDGRGQASGVRDLTARELEVVRLVAQGLTNGQIAARLFISTKTASVHVSNVLRKLGLSSRVELAEWAGAQGGL
jgi:DNA-binding CsgD family transcriptional regulator